MDAPAPDPNVHDDTSRLHRLEESVMQGQYDVDELTKQLRELHALAATLAGRLDRLEAQHSQREGGEESLPE